MKIALMPPKKQKGRPKFRWLDRRKLERLDAEQKQGFTARLSRRMQTIHAKIELSNSRFARTWRWVWKKLLLWVPKDEAMLRRFRTNLPEVLIHPANWTGEQALTSWQAYLVRRRWIAALWFVFYLIFGPAATLLSLLPGPNVIGYWFLYRGVCDGLSFWGAHRALRSSPPLTAVLENENVVRRIKKTTHTEAKANAVA